MTEAEERFMGSLVAGGIISSRRQRELMTIHQGNVEQILFDLARTHPQRRDELGRLWGNSLNVAYVNPAHTLVHFDLLRKLPEQLIKTKLVLPLYELGGAITIATPRPLDRDLRTQIESLLDAFVSAVFAFPDQIETALEIALQSETEIEELLDSRVLKIGSGAGALDAEELAQLSNDQSVVKFSRGIILFALKKRASDIHIEPQEYDLRIRFRIDGVLTPMLKLDRGLLRLITTRLKVMADLNIAESRVPQDGRIQLVLPDRTLDVRLSTSPTIYGEKSVLRILGTNPFAEVPSLSDLCLSRANHGQLLRAATAPQGLFLVTGPTGSGKSTTLCAAVNHLNQPGVNVLTIEDPIEYTIKGVNQVQVNEAVGLTFATALRSFLRQDPNVILVGEIRDTETAQVATQAALTGHLVLTTLHANSALLAVSRLMDLGVDPALLGPSLLGAMSQRLVRRLCDACKKRYPLSPEEIGEHFVWDGQTPVACYAPQGCEKCNQTGYQGRIGIHEVCLFDDKARSLVSRAVPADELERHIEAAGFLPMRYDGLKKALMGLTSLAEINRVLVED